MKVTVKNKDKNLKKLEQLDENTEKFFKSIDTLIKAFRFTKLKNTKIVADDTYKFTIALLDKLVKLNKKNGS